MEFASSGKITTTDAVIIAAKLELLSIFAHGIRLPPGGVTDCRVAGYGGLLLLRHFAVYEGDPHQEPHGRHLVPGTHHSGSAGRGVNSALFFSFFFFSFFLVLLCPLREIRLPYLGKAQQPQEQRYPFLSVCAVFSCVQTMV